jgi:hypothetical protein
VIGSLLIEIILGYNEGLGGCLDEMDGVFEEK